MANLAFAHWMGTPRRVRLVGLVLLPLTVAQESYERRVSGVAGATVPFDLGEKTLQSQKHHFQVF